MKNDKVLFLVLLASLLLSTGCYRNTIKEPKPRERDYDTGEYAASAERNRPAIGSVYSAPRLVLSIRRRSPATFKTLARSGSVISS